MRIKENGEWVRKFYFLDTELKKINFMVLSWTVVHPVDDKSPLFGLTEADLIDSEAEFVVMISATDDTYGQQVQKRYSYKPFQVVWNAKFNPMFRPSNNNNLTILELDRINEFERLGALN
jgi:inward rectifier potassium channel